MATENAETTLTMFWLISRDDEWKMILKTILKNMQKSQGSEC